MKGKQITKITRKRIVFLGKALAANNSKSLINTFELVFRFEKKKKYNGRYFGF